MPQNEFRPYVGPRPFERKDQAVFFGRDGEARELVSRVIAHPVVLIYSQSGAGKTSLINARLIPRLEEEEFEVLPPARVRGQIPRGIDPSTRLNPYVFNVLMNWAGDRLSVERLSSLSLDEYLAESRRVAGGAARDHPRVAVFDQFEELFTFYPEKWQERHEFFEQLSQALETDRRLRVVFAMREDYIAELDPYAAYLPGNLRTRFRLEQLREEAALTAIEQPLRGTDLSFEEGVAEQLVANLLKIQVKMPSGRVEDKTGEFVEPVQLQVVCQTLWSQMRAQGYRVITGEHVKNFGDVDQALSTFYAECLKQAVEQTGVKEGELRRWFEQNLITPVGTRGTVFRGEERAGGIPNEAVDKLEEQHLIRVELRGGARWYELTHDRLIEPIKMSNQQWLLQLSAAEETRRWLAGRAETWTRGGRGRAGLLDEGELSRADAFLTSPDAEAVGYGDSMVALVEASRAALEEEARGRDRQLAEEQQRLAESERLRAEEHRIAQAQATAARRLRRLTAALAVASLVAVGAAVGAVYMKRVAEAESRKTVEERSKAENALRALQSEMEAHRQAEELSAHATSQAEMAKAGEAEARKNAEIAGRAQKLKDEAADCYRLHAWDCAIAKYGELLRIQSAQPGNVSGKDQTLIDLGKAYRERHERHDYENASKMFRAAWLLRKEARGAQHQDSALILYELGELYRVWGKDKEAIKYYRQAEGIWSKKLNRQHPQLINLRQKLAELEGEATG